MNDVSPVSVPKASKTNRLCKFGFRLAALGLSISLALLVCEVGLRAAGYSPTYINAMGSFHQADDVCGHRGLANLEARFASTEFDVRVVHNEVGFRRLEWPPCKAECDRACSTVQASRRASRLWRCVPAAARHGAPRFPHGVLRRGDASLAR